MREERIKKSHHLFAFIFHLLKMKRQLSLLSPEDSIKVDLKDMVSGFNSGIVEFCEYGNEQEGSIKNGKFLTYPNDY